MSLVTSLGATVPATSTAPMTRSEQGRWRSMAERSLWTVTQFVGQDVVEVLHPVGIDVEDSHPGAEPAAILAALIPTMPPPMMSTSAGQTPGTPPMRRPPPPLRVAHVVGARR